MTEQTMVPIDSSPTHRNDILKIFALITMLIDHIGAIFFPDQLIWRTIGRIAFPIFSWQLVEGFVHTSSRSKYAVRLFIFGCVSQAPYMFLNPNLTINPLHINIIFQLFSGVLLLLAVERARSSLGSTLEKSPLSIILSFFWIAASLTLIIAPDLLNAWKPEFLFSYGTYGQLMFLVFYLFRKNPTGLTLAYMGISFFHAVEMKALWDINNSTSGYEGIKSLAGFWTDPGDVGYTALWSLERLPSLSSVFFQARSIVALPLIWIFENRPGTFKLNRWIGYWFYPVHIAVLVSIRWMMMQ